jgi:peptidoglycan/xylan/chitin deacetylase (PgdA/CDA1 family)
MRPVDSTRLRFTHFFLAALFVACCAYSAGASAANDCKKPVYLTFDTGHMEVAPAILQTLLEHRVQATFFAANERTKSGDGSLGEYWAVWWKKAADQGHEFASHTFDHVYWRADLATQPVSFRIKPSAGAQMGQESVATPAQYCKQLDQSSQRLQFMTGKPTLPLFRAPGGKTSAALLAAAKDCGYAHVGWADAGFLGDELPSEKFSNSHLLGKALRTIRSGDILMAHLGIWSRKDPWAPANLEPLITGLKAQGFCFDTLRNHPDYKGWITQRS